MDSLKTDKKTSGKVAVIGSYIVALVMDVNRMPIEGETLIGRNYHVTHGGKGSNMAVAAARLGGDAMFLGKIGQDGFGRDFIRLLERERVRVDGVIYSDRLPTAVGFILLNDRGMNSIVIDPAACQDFQPEEVESYAKLIDEADVVLSPLEIPLPTALAGARLAAKQGKKSILNPAPAQDLRHKDLRDVYVLTPNESEARTCLGLPPDDPIDDQEAARQLLQLGPENVIVTLGASGVLWASRDGSVVRVPALPVDVVDTTGAGDAFNAGLAVGLAEGRTMLDAIALGIVAASLSTRRRETVDSYPSRGEVDKRLEEVLAIVKS